MNDWRGGEDGQNDQTVCTRVANAVRHAFRSDKQIAGSHRQFAIPKEKHSSAGNDVVELIHSSMCVQRMLLAGLERVQSDQQTFGLKKRGLAHCVGDEDRVIEWLNDARMQHRSHGVIIAGLRPVA